MTMDTSVALVEARRSLDRASRQMRDLEIAVMSGVLYDDVARHLYAIEDQLNEIVRLLRQIERQD